MFEKLGIERLNGFIMQMHFQCFDLVKNVVHIMLCDNIDLFDICTRFTDQSPQQHHTCECWLLDPYSGGRDINSNPLIIS